LTWTIAGAIWLDWGDEGGLGDAGLPLHIVRHRDWRRALIGEYYTFEQVMVAKVPKFVVRDLHEAGFDYE
jgi:hypothetical protein